MEGGSVHRMCRCCAAEGSFKDIKTTYHWMGDEEVYGDMLSECFDVKLITSDHGGICEMCITHLRNAANFKKQVLETEEQFRKHLESGKFNRPPVVKQEFTMDDEMGESDDNMDNGEDDDYVPDFEVPIKTEDEMDEPVKPRKRACKATTSRAKKSKTEEKSSSSSDEEPILKDKSFKLIRNVNFNCFLSIPPSSPKEEKLSPKQIKKQKEIEPNVNLREKTKKAQQTKKVSQTKTKKVVPAKESTKEVGSDGYPKNVSELCFQVENVKTILKWSNATPIGGKKSEKYTCAFCVESYDMPSDLKAHTLANHKEKPKAHFLSTHRNLLSKYLVYLDITGLQCDICNADLENFDSLSTHLKTHDEIMHSIVKNQVMPLKSQETDLCCAVCDIILDFNIIGDHMAKHYNNYQCELCFLGFVNKSKLTHHLKIVHKV